MTQQDTSTTTPVQKITQILMWFIVGTIPLPIKKKDGTNVKVPAIIMTLGVIVYFVFIRKKR